MTYIGSVCDECGIHVVTCHHQDPVTDEVTGVSLRRCARARVRGDWRRANCFKLVTSLPRRCVAAEITMWAGWIWNFENFSNAFQVIVKTSRILRAILFTFSPGRDGWQNRPGDDLIAGYFQATSWLSFSDLVRLILCRTLQISATNAPFSGFSGVGLEKLFDR